MGFFKTIRQIKQATRMENEVRYRLSQMESITGLTQENVQLQLYVMAYDIKRYQKMGTSKDAFGRTVDWRATAKGFQGIVDVYEQVLEDGLQKWQGEAFLNKQFKKATKSRSEAANKYDEIYFAGQQKAIAGLQEGVLYFVWTNPRNPIAINPRFVRAIENRKLL